MKLFQKLLCTTLALLMTFALTGVSASASEELSGELVFWSWSEGETKGLAEAFNQEYPNITIKFVPVNSADYLTKFQTALVSSSELPDVALLEIDQRGAMVALDCWENLEAEPYNFDRSIVYPQILPVMTNARDEVVGFERELNPSGLSYKRELAKQWLGTDDPDEVGALIPDWGAFIELGASVAQESDGKVKFVSGLSDVVSTLKSQYTDTVFDGDKVYATKYFEYNLDIMIRINNAGIAGKLQTYSPAWNASYLDEEHLFYHAAPWSAAFCIKANDPDSEGRWGVCTPPLKGYSFGGTAYGIPQNAKNKDLAWAFICWATSESGLKACEEVVGAIVSVESYYANGFPGTPDPYFGGINVNEFLMEKCAPTMVIRSMNTYDVVLGDVMTLMADMITNDSSMTTEQAVGIAVQEMTNKLPPNLTIE